MEKESRSIFSRKPAILVCALVLAFSMLAVACGSSSDGSSSSSSASGGSSSTESAEQAPENPTLGSTFTFDGLEITFDDNYTFTTVDNEFSEYYQQDVVRVGFTITNISDETTSLNMFYWTLFGPSGTEANDVGSYFDDDAFWNSGEMKPGASMNLAFYMVYEGDGTYSIDFDNYSENVSVEFDVVK